MSTSIFPTSLIPPLYFVRSGNILINISRLRYAGFYGDDWPTTSSSKHSSGSAEPSAYYLGFGATGVLPLAGPVDRWLGYPLRWLVIGGGKYNNDYLAHSTSQLLQS